MAALKERYAGQMDFAKASATVKGLLSEVTSVLTIAGLCPATQRASAGEP